MHLLQALARRLLPVAVAFVAALSMTAVAQSGGVDEGREYLRLKNPQPKETGKKIEVIEFFSYGCPHCADLEPILQNWMKTMPADVQLRRILAATTELFVKSGAARSRALDRPRQHLPPSVAAERRHAQEQFR